MFETDLFGSWQACEGSFSSEDSFNFHLICFFQWQTVITFGNVYIPGPKIRSLHWCILVSTHYLPLSLFKWFLCVLSILSQLVGDSLLKIITNPNTHWSNVVNGGGQPSLHATMCLENDNITSCKRRSTKVWQSYLYNQSSSFSNCLLAKVILQMAQAVSIMSANNQLTDDAVQIKNKCKDPERTNQIQVEAEEEDDPQQWEELGVRSIVLIKAEWWGLAFHWKNATQWWYMTWRGTLNCFNVMNDSSKLLIKKPTSRGTWNHGSTSFSVCGQQRSTLCGFKWCHQCVCLSGWTSQCKETLISGPGAHQHVIKGAGNVKCRVKLIWIMSYMFQKKDHNICSCTKMLHDLCISGSEQ